MSLAPTLDDVDLARPEGTHGEDLRRAAIDLSEGLFQSDFTIRDMACAGCIRKLERGFDDVPGIETVRANLSLKRLSVTWRDGEIDPGSIENRIEALGFSAMPFDLSALSQTQDETGRELLIALAVAGFAATNIMLLSVSVWSGTDPATTQLFHLISGVIAIPAVFFAGRPFFRSALTALKAGRLNMDVPISLAVTLALAMSIVESLTGGSEAYFDAAVSLLFFLLIGRYLDHLMRRRARHSVDQLSDLTARGAMVVNGDSAVHYTPLGDIAPGDIIRVRPGDRVPLDGRLLSSAATFDRSLVTGESDPVVFDAGAEIDAGTLNLSTSIDIAVLRAEDQSFVAEIVRLIEAAEGGRSRYVRIADRMAQIYAPAVHLLAFLAFVGWFIVSGDWQMALYTAIAVLIVTCPCALGLAVPVVHVIAATRLFKAGIMMKDGGALERMAEINTVFFDKTGTLTTGLSSSMRVSGDKALLPVAKALATHSSHPIAASIADHINADTQVTFESDVQEDIGNGMQAVMDGRTFRLGRAEWVRTLHPGLPGDGLICADDAGRFVRFEIGETLRPGAVEGIAELAREGHELALISGDSREKVAAIAARAGIQDAQFDMRPKDKIDALQTAAARGAKVLMVGDGLNDAAALSEGYASMAPASACDVGRAAADFVFTRDDLTAVPLTLTIARRAALLVKQNFALAILYNCVAVPCAMMGLVTPLFAALAMSLSSIIVVGNSMRLNWEHSRAMPHIHLNEEAQAA